MLKFVPWIRLQTRFDDPAVNLEKAGTLGKYFHPYPNVQV
jgi:hypothetical protein